MKKLLFAVVAVGIMLFTGTCAFSGQKLKLSKIPDEIVITLPEETDRVTSSQNISILGACNTKSPLYMNGELVEVTENGFFCKYVELTDGENIFTFKCGEGEKTVSIVKIPRWSGVASLPEPELYEAPKVGLVCLDYASHRAKPDEDPKLLTPLAKGTKFNLIGETKEYFYTEGGTYVYKAAIEVLEERLPDKRIEGAELVKDGEFIYFKLKMNVNSLYSIEREGSKARLTINNINDLTGGYIKGNEEASVKKTETEKGVMYDIDIGENVTGHFVEFDGGWMTLSFKRAQNGIKGAVIVIDAGHGGYDPGALGPPGVYGPFEKDFNLQIALAAKGYLESRGAKVIMTRSGDDYIPLSERVTEVIKNKPDISVSVHGNSSPVTYDYNKRKGPLTYYTFDGSKEAAESIHKYITERLKMDYTEPIRENLALTRITNCPAILFEASFLCNPDDYEKLCDQAFLNGVGVALGKGIENYLIK